MQINYVKGDLLNVQKGVIVQGVNCQGVMGSGVAKAIRDKYPEVFTQYADYCSNHHPDDLLGQTLYVKVRPDLVIANGFSQLNYGRTGERYVSYDAIHKIFEDVSCHFSEQVTINIPKIGAGLGGGDWNVISSIIRSIPTNHQVTCYEL